MAQDGRRINIDLEQPDEKHPEECNHEDYSTSAQGATFVIQAVTARSNGSNATDKRGNNVRRHHARVAVVALASSFHLRHSCPSRRWFF
jgi:hypothetical protein